jgi:hypothetical protein
LFLSIFSDPLAALGVLSGVLTIVGYLPYVRDTLRRETQPDRASWLIWSVLGTLSFGSQIYEGATSSLWFAFIQVAGTILVFTLSISLGAGQYLSRKNRMIFLAACVGLVAWYLTESAVYTLAINISISLLGGSVTVLKAYEDPNSETLSTWLFMLTASVLAVLSVGEMDWVILAYPLYLMTLYSSIVMAVLLGRIRQARMVPVPQEAMFRSTRPKD